MLERSERRVRQACVRFGAKLQVARKRAAPDPDLQVGSRGYMTQADLANHLTRSRNTIVSWENGTRLPSLDDMKAIYEVLDRCGSRVEDLREMGHAWATALVAVMERDALAVVLSASERAWTTATQPVPPDRGLVLGDVVDSAPPPPPPLPGPAAAPVPSPIPALGADRSEHSGRGGAGRSLPGIPLPLYRIYVFIVFVFVPIYIRVPSPAPVRPSRSHRLRVLFRLAVCMLLIVALLLAGITHLPLPSLSPATVQASKDAWLVGWADSRSHPNDPQLAGLDVSSGDVRLLGVSGLHPAGGSWQASPAPSGALLTGAAVAGDGRSLAYLDIAEYGATATPSIWTVPLAPGPGEAVHLGGTPRELAPGCAYGCGSPLLWSPSGAWLLSATDFGLVAVDVHSGTQRIVLAVPSGETFGYPSCSPDGSYLALAHEDNAGRGELEVLRGRDCLPADPPSIAARIEAPAGLDATFAESSWSGDGSYLTYRYSTNASDGTSSRVYVVPRDTLLRHTGPLDATQALTASPEGCSMPMWVHQAATPHDLLTYRCTLSQSVTGLFWTTPTSEGSLATALPLVVYWSADLTAFAPLAPLPSSHT